MRQFAALLTLTATLFHSSSFQPAYAKEDQELLAAINLGKTYEVLDTKFSEEGYVFGSSQDSEREEETDQYQFTKEYSNKRVLFQSSKESEIEWNMRMVKAENIPAPAAGKVKVALIDSGVDFTEEIEVAVRKNFVPGEDEIPYLFEDISGHGTSIAGLLAAKDNGEGITGMNPYVELYSAKVLDENLKAPVSRVVEAIYWAISQEVNIISISFGITTDSEELRQAILAAYDAGILIIAAAGNHGTMEYPAAYDEVIAVGSVDSQGNRQEGSAVGNALELMAPGDCVLSTGAFDGVVVFSGTSMAVPHVVGVASALWQKDLTCSADFIRFLLDSSANLYGNQEEYGYGLVDYEYAASQYDRWKEIFAQNATAEMSFFHLVTEYGIQENRSAVLVFDDVDYVEGSWGPTKHDALADANSAASGKPLSAEALKIVKLGAVAPDTHIDGMLSYPEWHGNTSCKPDGSTVLYYVNYMSSYLYLTEIAAAVYKGTSPNNVTPSVSITDDVKNGIKNHLYSDGIISKKNEKLSWSTLLSGNTVSNRNKALFMYGMALHTATDMFAHNSYDTTGKYIDHAMGADKEKFFGNRYDCAEAMASQIVAHIKNFEVGKLSDYYAVAKSTYDKSFYLASFSSYAEQIDSSYYNANKAVFDKMDLKKH